MQHISIKGKCNINCSFCNYNNEPYTIDINSHYREVINRLDKIKNKNDEVIFGVGPYEPTTFPKFIDIIKHAKKLEFKKLILQTNLIKLSDINYAKKIKLAGIDTIYATLFVHDNKSSNSIAQSKNNIFDNKILAINNCQELGYDIKLSILILTSNYFNLSKTRIGLSKTDSHSQNSANVYRNSTPLKTTHH